MVMATLYRKHRPMNFEETVGQNHIKITLQSEIQASKIAHAYLFCGPRGVGKTTLARVFTKSINCLTRKEGEHEPCNQCDSCNDINDNRSMDIIEIDAASHTGVDNVRENIIASARVASSRSKYKVFIIDEVHMLSISAFNALLKTIEEPPSHVVFILCTTETHKVPATIISRCQRFDFKRISVQDVVKKLSYIARKEEIKIDNKILDSIARHSEGYMRDAESLFGQIVSIGGKEITEEEADLVLPRSDVNEIISLIEILAKKNCGEGIALINKLVDNGMDLKAFVSDLIEVFRKIMLNKISPGLSKDLSLDFSESFEIRINDVSRDFQVERLIVIIEKFIEARIKLKDSFITQLPLELAVAELCLAGQARNAEAVNTALQGPNKPNPSIINQSPVMKSVDGIQSAQSQTQSHNVSINLSKEDVLSKWSEVLVTVKKYNHSLSFILRACQPKDINGNKLCLAFKYKFHKDRISDIQVKNMVEKILQEVYKNPISIEAIVDESLSVGQSVEPDTLSSPTEVSSVDMDQIEESRDQSIEVEKGLIDNNQAGGNGVVDDILKTFGGKVVS